MQGFSVIQNYIAIIFALLIGVLIVLDRLFDLNWGYKWSDLLLVLAIIVISLAVRVLLKLVKIITSKL